MCTTDQRRESVSCVSVNQCCEQIAHIFRRKKDCWAEKCELSQLYYSLQPSPSSRHIKGVCLHSTICLPSSKKKKKKLSEELGCVSDLMSYPRSAPRVPSNSAAWESRKDSSGGAAFSSQAQELSTFYSHSIQTYKYLRVDTFELSPYNLHNIAQCKSTGPDPWLGLSCLGGGEQLDRARHPQTGGNEIRACIISTLPPSSPRPYRLCENVGTG